jgi:hypothetical protein
VNRGDRRRRCGPNSRNSRSLHRPLRIEPLEDRRLLAVITVGNLNDAGDDSLRAAIALANSTPGPDAIDFAAALSGGTIHLSSGELAITDTLTIDGSMLAHSVTIDANLLSRIFNFTASTGDLTLVGLSLTEGRTTGNNVVTGVPPAPFTTTFNGGAVRFDSTGTLTISNSLISGSRTQGIAAFGGGVFSAGKLVLDQSTVSGNETQGGYAVGGGVAALGGATITNSTVTDNHMNAPADGLLAGGGGIVAAGLVIRGSIVAGNTAIFGPVDIFPISYAPTVDYSLIGNISGSGITSATGVGNVLNQPPLLGPLADTGGATKIHLPLVGSPAIDMGDPNATAGVGDTPLVDQRGAPYARVFGGRIDIGAVESQPISLTVVVDSLADVSDGVSLTLRQAIELTNNIQGADSIRFVSLLSGGTILLSGGELAITDDVTIVGLGAAQLTIDAQNNSRVLVVDGMATAYVSGLALMHGSADRGAAMRINSEATATLADVDIHHNAATLEGGGIWNTGQLTILNSTFRDNTATDAFARGGGIGNEGTLEIRESTLSGNVAGTAGNGALGGGIFNSTSDGDATIVASTLFDNSSNYGGGGVANLDGTLTLTGSTLSGNGASYGGGVFERYGTATISGSTITGNIASFYGGALFADGYSTLTLDQTIVSGNTAPQGSEIKSDFSTTTVLKFNLLGDSSTTTAKALYGLMASPTDVTATSNGTTPTPLDGILDVLLADNGGPTLTHALASGSPAIDAGDPVAMAGIGDTPLYDQRGAPYTRVFGGRIDVGAIEAQLLPALVGDYNQDHVVDAADYTVWRDSLGQMGLAPYSGADGDGDGTVDSDDYLVWKTHFGETLTPVTLVVSSAGALAPIEAMPPAEVPTAVAYDLAAQAAPPPVANRAQRWGATVLRERLPYQYRDQQLLLAVDRAIAEIDLKVANSRWKHDSDDATAKRKSPLLCDDPPIANNLAHTSKFTLLIGS